MSRDWSDVAARARGLSSRLLGRPTLERLAESDVPPEELARLAGMSGIVDAVQLEPALRSVHGERLARLAGQAGRRSEALEVVFGEEDRRSVIALLRTIRGGRPAAEALAGLVPTPRLPRSSLDLLARQTTGQALGTLLASWQHPLGRPILDADGGLVDQERAIHRAHGASLRAAARRGDRFLREHVGLLLDLHNAVIAMLLVGADEPARGFVPGGRTLDEATWLRLLRWSRATEVAEALAASFQATPLAGVFDPDGVAVGIESAALSALLEHATRYGRLHPLGTAPIVAFALGLRAEAHDLRTLVWGAALGAPAPMRRARLVTP